MKKILNWAPTQGKKNGASIFKDSDFGPFIMKVCFSFRMILSKWTLFVVCTVHVQCASRVQPLWWCVSPKFPLTSKSQQGSEQQPAGPDREK